MERIHNTKIKCEFLNILDFQNSPKNIEIIKHMNYGTYTSY